MVRDKNRFVMRRTKASKKVLTVWFVISLILLAVTIGLLMLSTSIKKSDIQMLELYEKKMVQEIAVIGSLKKEQKNLEDNQKELNYKVRKVKKVGNIGRNTPHYYLKEVATLIPEQIVLHMFDFDTKGVQLEGTSFNVQSITQFMRALAQSTLFTRPKLVSMNRDEEASEGKVKFVIQVLKR